MANQLNKHQLKELEASKILDLVTELDTLLGGSSWRTAGGGGDMLKTTYDPNLVNGDVFDMTNMVEGLTSKILTDTERAQIAANVLKVSYTDAATVASNVSDITTLQDTTLKLGTTNYPDTDFININFADGGLTDGGNFVVNSAGVQFQGYEVGGLFAQYQINAGGDFFPGIAQIISSVFVGANSMGLDIHNANGMIINDQVFTKGLVNAADFSANSTARSLIDKAEIEALIVSGAGIPEAPNDLEIYTRSANQWLGSSEWIVDNLTTAVSEYALSAAQGKILNDSLVLKGPISLDVDKTGVTSTTYTLDSRPAGRYFVFEGTGTQSITVRLNDGLPIGTRYYFTRNNVGQTTFNPDVGVTMNSDIGLSTTTDNPSVYIVKIDVNEWDIVPFGTSGTAGGPEATTAGAGLTLTGVDIALGGSITSAVGSTFITGDDTHTLGINGVGATQDLQATFAPNGFEVLTLHLTSDEEANLFVEPGTGTGTARVQLQAINAALAETSLTLGVSSITILDEINSKGIVNAADYSANSTARSLIDKAEIEALILAGAGATTLPGLTDVTITTPVNGHVLTYQTGVWVNEAPVSGVTDHTLLSNIGTNTHAQIDTHIADATLHFTQASISIPASQVSDFDTEVSNNVSVAANTAKVTFPGFTSLLADYSFTDNSTNWNTAFGWGDHSGLYLPLATYDPATIAEQLVGLTAIQTLSNKTLTNTDSITFDLTKVSTPAVGELHWNNNDGTLNLGLLGGQVNLQVGQEMVVRVKALEAVTDGEVVYASGAVGASGVMEVNKYIANNTIQELQVLGVATESITLNGFGFITMLGNVRGIPTNGTNQTETWVNGDILYASPTVAGALTNIRPVAPNQDISIAMVINSAPVTGTIYVRPMPGNHLTELHDIEIGTEVDKDALMWNNANLRWENKQLVEADISDLGPYNNYTHPTGDGNLHVPANSTTNDGKVLTSGATAGLYTWETIPAGVTDHTLLTNIGTNTHAQIDTHIADGTLHYTQASISITESQISDLGPYNNYVHPNHSGDVVSTADGATVIQPGAVDIAMLSATGTPTASSFLRGDNVWATPAGSGNVSTSGAPVLNDFARFVNATDIEGRSYSEVRTDLGLVIGTNIQAYSADLDAVSGTNTGDNAINTLYSGLVSNVTTNLGYTAAPTNGTVTSSDGTNATLTLATGVNAGLMTPAYFTALASTSGSNTGDQTTIVGITGTTAQFNTALTAATFMFTGDAPTAHTHVAADVTDFDTEVSNNVSVAANTAKTTFPGFTSLLTDYGYTEPTHTASEIAIVDAGTLITATEVEAALQENRTAINLNTSKTSFPGFGTLLGDYGFTDNSANWNTAFGWGDHSGLYSLLAHTHTLVNVTDVTALAAEVNLLDLSGLTAGWVLSADTATTASWKAPAAGITDHTALSNIGTNTHAQIDTHIADATLHFTQAAISITESQISDLGPYNNYSHPTGDGNLHVPANSTTNDGKVLTAGATAGLYTWETHLHPTIVAATSANNSGRTYIQDVTLDANGHVTGLVSATETVVSGVTSIVAGNGLSGGTITTTGTLALDFAELGIGGTLIATDYIIAENGGVENRQLISAIPLGIFNNDQGWTSSVGTVTSVTGGTGVTSSGGATPSISLNFAELTDKTTAIAGTTEFILQDGTTESRKAASEIQLSFFSNNSGWTSNTGTVTSVGTVGPLTGTVTGSGNLSINPATTISDGYLSSTDWNTFNNKVSNITQTITLTGDVTGSGTGSFATTIATDAVDIAMLSATGTASTSTYLRGDNTWTTPPNTNTTNWNVQANGGTASNISAGEEVNFINGTNTTAVHVNQANPTVTFNMNTGGIGAGTYGSTSNATKIDNITVDAYGRVTAVATGATGSGTMSSFNVQANAGTQVAVTNAEELNFINGTATTAVVTNQTNPTVTYNVDLGTGATQAAAGNHTHSTYLTAGSADQKTSGTLTFNDNVRLGFGTSNAEGELYSNGTILYLDMKADKDLIIRDVTATRFTFDSSLGRLTATEDMYAVDFNLSSDERLKKDIKPLKEYKVITNWVEYNWIKNGNHDIGVIAQDLEKTNPEFVKTGEDGMKSVNYTKLLIAKNIDLENRIERLEKALGKIINK